MKFNIHHEYVSIGSQTAKCRIILLHGWGADYDDLLPLGESIVRNSELDWQLIFLKAPSLRANNSGREWYGLFPANWQEATREVENLKHSLDELGKSVSLKKTVLLGFSQGAAMSIAVCSKIELGLVVSCSGYAHPDWDPKIKCPILLSHGVNDDIVPITTSRDMYKKIKINTESLCQLHEFNGAHEIDPEFIFIIRKKIKMYI